MASSRCLGHDNFARHFHGGSTAVCMNCLLTTEWLGNDSMCKCCIWTVCKCDVKIPISPVVIVSSNGFTAFEPKRASPCEVSECMACALIYAPCHNMRHYQPEGCPACNK